MSNQTNNTIDKMLDLLRPLNPEEASYVLRIVFVGFNRAYETSDEEINSVLKLNSSLNDMYRHIKGKQ